MELAVMIEGQNDVSWKQWASLGRACEELGFGALFASDHFLAVRRSDQRGGLDPWIALTGVAGVTTRLRLGTLVSSVTFRNPALLARIAASLDVLSAGRAEVGLGAGWFEGEHRRYGFLFPSASDRFGMLEEQLVILHRLWEAEGGDRSVSGRYFRLERAPAVIRPVQSPRPPIILGGGAGRRGALLAATWADEYNVAYIDPSTAIERKARLATACEAVGRDPVSLRYSLMTVVVVAENEHELVHKAMRVMERRNESGDARAFLDGVRSQWLVGTVTQIADRLALFAEVGVDRVIMKHVLHEDSAGLRQLGEGLVPTVGAW